MAGKDYSILFEGGSTGILLIHGLCGTPTELRYIANGLARQGYTVSCPQLAGHCDGEDALRTSTWKDWVQSAQDALDELSKRCDKVIVGGLSTGALIAMVLAHRNPDRISGLTLYSPTMWLTGRQVPWYAKLFNLVLTKSVADLFTFPVPHKFGIKDERLRAFLDRALKSPGAPVIPVTTPGSAVLERRWLAKYVAKIVKHISQPTLIIHPREDDYAGMDNTFYLQKNLAGHVDMLVLDDSYHIITVDRQRDQVLQRTTEFLGRFGTAHKRQIQKNCAHGEIQAAA